MSKISKTILISVIAVFGVGLLPSFVLANGLIDITFEQEPLFQETNFLPGQSVTHWIEVENKSLETQPIGIEVINHSSCSSDCFSDRLNLTISENSTKLYESSLTNFFGAGEIKLSDLAANGTTKYFFSVTFLPGSGNEYQEKEVGFDFRIGALGKESIGGEIPENGTGNGGGSGGFFIPGLEIFNETILSVEVDETTITWETNISATSRVIYSSQYQNHTLQLDNPPNYDYFYSTAEDSLPKVNHQMVITGLTPGTTYYFRCVSRGSLAVSKELSFTTAAVAGEAVEIIPTVSLAGDEEKVEGEALAEEIGPILGEEPEAPEVMTEVEESSIIEDISEFGIMCSLLLFVIVVLLILYLLSVLFKNKKEGKKSLILPLITAVLIILYCVFCCSACGSIFCCKICWILIVVFIILLFLDLFWKRKKSLPQ